MFNIGSGEMILIALVLLIAVGPEQLPGLIRRGSRALGQLRSMSDGLRRDLMSSMDELERASDPRKWAETDLDEGERAALGRYDAAALAEAQKDQASDEEADSTSEDSQVEPASAVASAETFDEPDEESTEGRLTTDSAYGNLVDHYLDDGDVVNDSVETSQEVDDAVADSAREHREPAQDETEQGSE